MKLPNLFTIAFLIFCGLSFIACSGGKNATTSTATDANTVDLGYGKAKKGETNAAHSTIKTGEPNNLNLVDYLRRTPGLQVSGSTSNPSISIRGAASSILGENTPLFVLDNTIVGNNYSQVESLVDPNDIDKITVLRDGASTSMYGARGSAGVIVIKTKKR